MDRLLRPERVPVRCWPNLKQNSGLLKSRRSVKSDQQKVEPWRNLKLAAGASRMSWRDYLPGLPFINNHLLSSLNWSLSCCPLETLNIYLQKPSMDPSHQNLLTQVQTTSLFNMGKCRSVERDFCSFLAGKCFLADGSDCSGSGSLGSRLCCSRLELICWVSSRTVTFSPLRNTTCRDYSTGSVGYHRVLV